MAIRINIQLLITMLTLSGLTTGCAVHYYDTRSGMEHLWGLGQMRLEQQTAGVGCTVVVSSFRVPGLCLEVGRNDYGINFGYLNRQQLLVVNTSTVLSLIPPQATFRLSSSNFSKSIWGLGYVRMRTAANSNNHYAIITGKALAGLGGSIGINDNGLGPMLSGSQRTKVFDQNIALDFNQQASRWPGFDLFSVKVNACIETNLINEKRNHE